MISFSIIICCYNSSSRIEKTLLYLSKLRISNYYLVEIIIVDNCSNDNIENVSLDYWKRLNSPFPISFFKEASKGLSNARICGIINSKYDYLIFCDDDNYLFPDYLYQIEITVSRYNCAIIGGKGFPISNNLLPDWFYEFGQSAFAVGDFERKLGFGSISYGAGMVIKRDIALKYAYLKSNLFLSDRQGKSLSSGGDSELCLLVGLDSIYYNPDLRFYHNLFDRVSLKYYLKLNKSFAKAEAFLLFYKLSDMSLSEAKENYKKILYRSIKLFILLLFKRKVSVLNRVKRVFNFYFSLWLIINFISFQYLLNKALTNKIKILSN